jgi:hypothetical protein
MSVYTHDNPLTPTHSTSYDAVVACENEYSDERVQESSPVNIIEWHSSGAEGSARRQLVNRIIIIAHESKLVALTVYLLL